MPDDSPQKTDRRTARRWAIEEAIKLHGANGSTVDYILRDAETLMAWVEKTDDKKSD